MSIEFREEKNIVWKRQKQTGPGTKDLTKGIEAGRLRGATTTAPHRSD